MRMPAETKYKRILLKLSGEALLGEANYGIDPKVLNRLARETQEVQRAGMPWMTSEHIARDSRGFVRATSIDGGPTKTKGLLIGSDRNPIRVVVVHARPTSFGASTIAPYPKTG